MDFDHNKVLTALLLVLTIPAVLFLAENDEKAPLTEEDVDIVGVGYSESSVTDSSDVSSDIVFRDGEYRATGSLTYDLERDDVYRVIYDISGEEQISREISIEDGENERSVTFPLESMSSATMFKACYTNKIDRGIEWEWESANPDVVCENFEVEPPNVEADITSETLEFGFEEPESFSNECLESSVSVRNEGEINTRFGTSVDPLEADGVSITGTQAGSSEVLEPGERESIPVEACVNRHASSEEYSTTGYVVAGSTPDGSVDEYPFNVEIEIES